MQSAETISDVRRAEGAALAITHLLNICYPDQDNVPDNVPEIELEA